MSSSKIYVGNNAKSATSAERLSGYTGVILTKDANTIYKAGDSSGKVLEVTIPFASQAMADNMLAQIYDADTGSGYSFQPLTITGGIVNPAAELGDAVTSHGKYTGIFNQTIYYGDRLTEDLKANAGDTTEHEYTYKGKGNQYATISGLAAGTTTVNGAGISSGSISGSSVKTGTITGGSSGNIATNTVTTDNTDDYLTEASVDAHTAIAYIDAWLNGSGATFGGIDVSSLNCTGVFYYGGYAVNISSTDGRLYVSKTGG